MALVTLFLVFTPQGQDIISSVVDRNLLSTSDWVCAPPFVSFWACATLLGVEAWFWSRKIIQDNYGPSPADWKPRGLLTVAPRILGAWPFWLAALSILMPKTRAVDGGLVIAASVVAGGVMICLLALRRRFFGPDANPGPIRKWLAQMTGRAMTWGSVIAAPASIGLFWLSPVAAPQFLGPAAVVFLAVALMIPIIAGLAHLVRLTQIPVVALSLALLFAVSTFFSDNHEIGARRAFPPEAPAHLADVTPIPIADAFHRWFCLQKAVADCSVTPAAMNARKGMKPIPLVIAVSEGGASRAGYWTALMLSELEYLSDHKRPFSSRLFAVSSVSGGSVGAAAFVAVTHGRSGPVDPQTGIVTQFSGEDFLSPALADMLFLDLPQRFIPFGFVPDRAEALERSWEVSWRKDCEAVPVPSGCADPHAMERGFQSFWSDIPSSSRWTPLLMVNGTREEDGRRIITAPVAIDPADFPEALAFHSLVSHDIRMSTAILNGARFPVVSPGGRLGDGHGRIIDGGYFDGIGAATAADLARTVMNLAVKQGVKILPVIVEINNDDGAWSPEFLRTNDDAKLDINALQVKTNRTFDDELGPLIGLYSARGAHATHSAIETARFGPGTAPIPAYLFLHLFPYHGQQMPMDWTASQAARERAQHVAGVSKDGSGQTLDPCLVRTQLVHFIQALQAADPGTALAHTRPIEPGMPTCACDMVPPDGRGR